MNKEKKSKLSFEDVFSILENGSSLFSTTFVDKPKHEKAFNKESIKLLSVSLDKINSVPYKVNVRWLFYQLVQDGLLDKTANSMQQLNHILSRARKKFRYGFTPTTLIDTIRECHHKGFAGYTIAVKFDTIKNQEYYVELWFEAEAMLGQFQHITQDYRVSLIPFRGDISLPMKWDMAKWLEHISQEYNKPIKILYFGDCDKKGEQIPQSALRDIRAWCSVPFDFEVIGLTLEQAQQFKLPENPDKPNNYQWEALSDSQAENLVVPAVEKYIYKVNPRIQIRETEIEEKIKKHLNRILR